MSDRSVRIESATDVQVNSGDGANICNIFVQTPEEAAAVQAALSAGQRLESLDIRGVVHNLPFARNNCFTGREGVLERIETAFGQPDPVAITQPHAIHGLGGIDKSQIAMEYAYQHLMDYRYVFWVGAESEAALYKSFSQLAVILDLSASLTPKWRYTNKMQLKPESRLAV